MVKLSNEEVMLASKNPKKRAGRKKFKETFPMAEMAARAHDVAAIALRGRFACLNFADSVWRLPMPASAEAKDIQRAAAEAAEMFRPTELDKVSGDELRPMGKNAVSIATIVEATKTEAKGVFFIDEEAVFGMASRRRGAPSLLCGRRRPQKDPRLASPSTLKAPPFASPHRRPRKARHRSVSDQSPIQNKSTATSWCGWVFVMVAVKEAENESLAGTGSQCQQDFLLVAFREFTFGIT
ncbi:hypothetical protein CMV_015731 [Castanea mollissima]|uniref:AP2/ERF domain-containing protein n=1 Tax=Castanea mollissima TaxID=60419 RepID=A0A8J4VFS1_9ROSI|nr:hypothetical protein CMV_015731 [Castanea mollissima]